MLIDIINDIYESKRYHDSCCIENMMPFETMEQFLYTYLNHKYGLKNLVKDWIKTILSGIKFYSNEDSDVLLFGMILRNEIDEDTKDIIDKLKGSILEMVELNIKAKHPLKTADEIKEILKHKVSSLISEDEWKSVIYYIYEKEDAAILETMVFDQIRKNNELTEGKIVEIPRNKTITREEIEKMFNYKENTKIPYKHFLKILLDFQIHNREKYLRNFLLLFKKADIDNNGIIDEDEFIRLISSIKIYKENDLNLHLIRLLKFIDPYNHKQITFSNCVKLFSRETLFEGGENRLSISLLDKISIEDDLLLI